MEYPTEESDSSNTTNGSNTTVNSGPPNAVHHYDPLSGKGDLPLGWENPPKVLLVDDDEISIAPLRLSFQKIGCHVTVATSGFDAINELVDSEFDLMVIDWIMPGLDGVETIRKAEDIVSTNERPAQLWQHWPLPVVTFSAYVFPWGDLRHCEHFNFMEHWQKPIRYNHLKFMVSDLLSRISSRRIN